MKKLLLKCWWNWYHLLQQINNEQKDTYNLENYYNIQKSSRATPKSFIRWRKKKRISIKMQKRRMNANIFFHRIIKWRFFHSCTKKIVPETSFRRYLHYKNTFLFVEKFLFKRSSVRTNVWSKKRDRTTEKLQYVQRDRS